MAEWLSLIGIGEDGFTGLGESAKAAVRGADIVFGGPRHLAMVDHPDRRPWPVPFDMAPLLACKGKRVAALISGDPFHFGAGTLAAKALLPDEWKAYPTVSIFSLMAAELGWALETTPCLGLHARPMSLLRSHLHKGARIMVTLRHGASAVELGNYLSDQGFGSSRLHLFSRLGGPLQKVHSLHLSTEKPPEMAAPLACAIEVEGHGAALPLNSGLEDHWFDHDGQITKRPMRALALSALSPRAGELLWDIGTGSGSVAIEWMLRHPSMQAIGFEKNAQRAARAESLCRRTDSDGESKAEALRVGLCAGCLPDAVFIGGGADAALLHLLWEILPEGTRLVAHAVTLETEALLGLWHSEKGGSLLRIELAEAAALGSKRGWKASYPVVQWQVVR